MPRFRPHDDSAVAQQRPRNLVAGLQAQALAHVTWNRDLSRAGHGGWFGRSEVHIDDLHHRKSARSRGRLENDHASANTSPISRDHRDRCPLLGRLIRTRCAGCLPLTLIRKSKWAIPKLTFEPLEVEREAPECRLRARCKSRPLQRRRGACALMPALPTGK